MQETPIPRNDSATASGQPRQESGSGPSFVLRFRASRMQTLRPALASQVAASGVGAIAVAALKPWLARPETMRCRSALTPPNSFKLPAISNSSKEGASIQTKDVNFSAHSASACKTRASRFGSRSSRQSAGLSASAALIDSPGLIPAARASMLTKTIFRMPLNSSNTALAASALPNASSGNAGK